MRRKLTEAAAVAVLALSSTADAEAVNRYDVVAPFNAKLDRMAYCESRGRWFLDGRFDGGLQFSPLTWKQTGSPYAFAFLAPIIEQKFRAVVWARKIGWAWTSRAGWPRCGSS